MSARTRYERFYPNQPLCWKAAAFAHEVNEIYEANPHSKMDTDDDYNASCGSLDSTDVSSDEDTATSVPPKQIISFGDSMEERTAVRIVSKQLAATSKSVLFVSSPSPTEIIGQLNLVTSHMAFVCEHESSLDLQISPAQAQRCAESYLKTRIRGADSCRREALIEHSPSESNDAVTSQA